MNSLFSSAVLFILHRDITTEQCLQELTRLTIARIMAKFIASQRFCLIFLVLVDVNMLDGKGNVSNATCKFDYKHSVIGNPIVTFTCDSNRNLSQNDAAYWLKANCTVLIRCQGDAYNEPTSDAKYHPVFRSVKNQNRSQAILILPSLICIPFSSMNRAFSFWDQVQAHPADSVL